MLTDAGRDEEQEGGESWREGEGPRGFFRLAGGVQPSGLSREAPVSCSCLCHSQGQSMSEAPLWVWNAPSTFAPNVRFHCVGHIPGDQGACRCGSGGDRRQGWHPEHTPTCCPGDILLRGPFSKCPVGVGQNKAVTPTPGALPALTLSSPRRAAARSAASLGLRLHG